MPLNSLPASIVAAAPKRTQELPFDEQLDTAVQLVLSARIFYDIWRFHVEQETRVTIIDVMREYSEFFRYDPYAHFVSFIVHISNLFDSRRKDVISLPGLVRRCKAAKLIEASVIAEVESLIQEQSIAVNGVLTLRHHVFAHRSAFLTYAASYESADLTPNQLRGLTDAGLRVVNRLSIARGKREQAFTEFPLDHAKAMLNALGPRG